jgi:hypothetical protein
MADSFFHQDEVSAKRGQLQVQASASSTPCRRTSQLEAACGGPLSWERLDDKRAARVRSISKEGGVIDKAKRPRIRDAMISAMDRLLKAVKPFLADK